MKESYNTSKLFKQRKQPIWNLKFRADTAVIFNQMKKTLNLQYHGIFCIKWHHIKVFTKFFYRKSVCPVIWWAIRKEKPAKFLETVILCEAFRGNFKNKVGSSLYYHTKPMRTCFCVSICLIFRFAYLAYYCFCAMLFSVSHLSIMDISCCLCYMPGVYLKSPMLCLRCDYCFLFSKIC